MPIVTSLRCHLSIPCRVDPAVNLRACGSRSERHDSEVSRSILRTPSAMSMPLRVLIIEDEPDDAELMLAALLQADFEPDAARVADEPAFRALLGTDVDVILADY